MKTNKVLLNGDKLKLVLLRLAQQIVENSQHIQDLVLIGIQPRGITLAKHIHTILGDSLNLKNIYFGTLDPTFFRDDLHKSRDPILPHLSSLTVNIEDKRIILIDDVLYTGRTARAATEAIISYGRPKKIELLCLVNRRFSRHVPISPDYVGVEVDTALSQKVRVKLTDNYQESSVVII